MVIVVFQEFCKLLIHIVCRPKQNGVEIFAPDTADQSFGERMGHRHVRHGLDVFNFKNAEGCLPLVIVELEGHYPNLRLLAGPLPRRHN